MARNKAVFFFGLLGAVGISLFLFTIPTQNNEPFPEITKMKAKPSIEQPYTGTKKTGVYSSPKYDEGGRQRLELGSSAITGHHGEDNNEEEYDREPEDQLHDQTDDGESATAGGATDSEMSTQMPTIWDDLHTALSSRNVYLTIDSKGKLGNQMFQYATLYCLTKRRPAWTPYLKGKKSYIHLMKTFRRLTIGRLPFSPSDQLTVNLMAEPNADTLLRKLARLPTDRNVTVRGYFQSYRFFNECQDDIREQFQFADDWSRFAERQLLTRIPIRYRNEANLTRVGIHVRRTTMVIDEKLALGYVSPPPSYYRRAMEYFALVYERVVFVVTSDDVTWCEEQFRADDDVVFAEGSFAGDLLTLTICDHVITSVGTYSWWAGWLNTGTTIYYGRLPKADTYAGQLYANDSYIPPDDRYNKWIAIV